MSFVGVTFDGQNVSPKDDGALYATHNGDGIIDGCSMTISGDDLVIQSGHIIACGRQCKVDGATTVDLSTRQLSTGYIQVILNYDLSQGEGSQWYESFVESATTTFPALTQDDINGTDTLYQLELAIVEISGGSLTAITKSLSVSGALLRGISNIVNASGNIIGKIDGTNWDNLGHAPMFGSCQSDGTTIGGMIPYSDGTVSIGGTGGEIAFRPNGLMSSVGAVRIDGSGQIIGGVTYSSDSRSSTTTVPAGGSWVTVVGKNGLASGGIYLISAYLTYSPNSTQANQQLWVRLNSSNGNFHSQVFSIPYQSSWGCTYTEILWNAGTSINVQCSTQSSTLSGTVATGATIRLLRIA